TAGAVAVAADVDVRTRLGAAAAAALAGVDQVVGDLNAGAGRGLRERDLDLDADVAALDAASGGPAPERAERIAAEERVEDVGKRAEAVRSGREPARVEPVEAVAVIGGAPFGVGQDLVGLGGLLELL